MGKNHSTQLHHHHHLGNVEIFNNLIVLKTVLNSLDQLKFWQYKIYNQPKHSFILYPIQHSINMLSCNSNVQLFISFPFYPFTLKNQFQNRHISGFSEQQVWNILYLLLSTAKELQIGDLNQENIWINKNGMIKIATKYSWPNKITAFEKVANNCGTGILSPQQLKKLNAKTDQKTHDPKKSEMFCIGIFILSLMSLTNYQTFYKENNKLFSEKIQQQIKSCQKKYSRFLIAILYSMLQFNCDYRTIPQTLLHILKKYQNPILKFQKWNYQQQDLKKVQYLAKIKLNNQYKNNNSIYIPINQKQQSTQTFKINQTSYSNKIKPKKLQQSLYRNQKIYQIPTLHKNESNNIKPLQNKKNFNSPLIQRHLSNQRIFQIPTDLIPYSNQINKNELNNMRTLSKQKNFYSYNIQKPLSNQRIYQISTHHIPYQKSQLNKNQFNKMMPLSNQKNYYSPLIQKPLSNQRIFQIPTHHIPYQSQIKKNQFNNLRALSNQKNFYAIPLSNQKIFQIPTHHIPYSSQINKNQLNNIRALSNQKNFYSPLIQKPFSNKKIFQIPTHHIPQSNQIYKNELNNIRPILNQKNYYSPLIQKPLSNQRIFQIPTHHIPYQSQINKNQFNNIRALSNQKNFYAIPLSNQKIFQIPTHHIPYSIQINKNQFNKIRELSNQKNFYVQPLVKRTLSNQKTFLIPSHHIPFSNQLNKQPEQNQYRQLQNQRKVYLPFTKRYELKQRQIQDKYNKRSYRSCDKIQIPFMKINQVDQKILQFPNKFQQIYNKVNLSKIIPKQNQTNLFVQSKVNPNIIYRNNNQKIFDQRYQSINQNFYQFNTDNNKHSKNQKYYENQQSNYSEKLFQIENNNNYSNDKNKDQIQLINQQYRKQLLQNQTKKNTIIKGIQPYIEFSACLINNNKNYNFLQQAKKKKQDEGKLEVQTFQMNRGFDKINYERTNSNSVEESLQYKLPLNMNIGQLNNNSNSNSNKFEFEGSSFSNLNKQLQLFHQKKESYGDKIQIVSEKKKVIEQAYNEKFLFQKKDKNKQLHLQNSNIYNNEHLQKQKKQNKNIIKNYSIKQQIINNQQKVAQNKSTIKQGQNYNQVIKYQIQKKPIESSRQHKPQQRQQLNKHSFVQNSRKSQINQRQNLYCIQNRQQKYEEQKKNQINKKDKEKQKLQRNLREEMILQEIQRQKYQDLKKEQFYKQQNQKQIKIQQQIFKKKSSQYNFQNKKQKYQNLIQHSNFHKNIKYQSSQPIIYKPQRIKHNQKKYFETKYMQQKSNGQIYDSYSQKIQMAHQKPQSLIQYSNLYNSNPYNNYIQKQKKYKNVSPYYNLSNHSSYYDSIDRIQDYNLNQKKIYQLSPIKYKEYGYQQPKNLVVSRVLLPKTQQTNCSGQYQEFGYQNKKKRKKKNISSQYKYKYRRQKQQKKEKKKFNHVKQNLIKQHCNESKQMMSSQLKELEKQINDRIYASKKSLQRINLNKL